MRDHFNPMNPLDDAFAPRKARIEIIPLIDVIFFLLATFVLFTLSLEKIGAITVPLPKTPPIIPTALDTTVYLQASEAGALYWKIGRESPAEFLVAAELRGRLENYKRSVAEPRVLVRGDTKAKFGATVALLDEVRQAGIKQVSVETLVSATGN